MIRAPPPPLIHFLSLNPAEARPCWAPRCWCHPRGFLTANLPARFNQESADNAILAVNLLGAMQTLVGKGSSGSVPLTTAVARTRWEAMIFIQPRISEEQLRSTKTPSCWHKDVFKNQENDTWTSTTTQNVLQLSINHSTNCIFYFDIWRIYWGFFLMVSWFFFSHCSFLRTLNVSSSFIRF